MIAAICLVLPRRLRCPFVSVEAGVNGPRVGLCGWADAGNVRLALRLSWGERLDDEVFGHARRVLISVVADNRRISKSFC